MYGHMGIVDFIIRKMKREYSEHTGELESNIKVIATGGLATMISKGIDSIDHVDRLLTLEGLRLIYDKNRNNFSNRIKLSRESRENIEIQAEKG